MNYLDEFINALINIETINIKNSKIYNNVYDKYLNGHCEDLVDFLLHYCQDGKKIKIKGICQEFDVDEIVYHYVFNLNDKYYDINGEFDNLDDLVNQIGYIDIIDEITLCDSNKLNYLDSNELYNNIIDSLNNTFDMDR